MPTGFYSSLAGAIRRHRVAVLILYAIVTIALAWLGSGITLESDLTALLPEGTPSAEDLRLYLERFGTADALFVSLEARSDDALDELDTIDALETASGMAIEALESTGLFTSVRDGHGEEEGIELARRVMTHLPVLLPIEASGDLRERLSREGIDRAVTRLETEATGPLMLGPRKALAAEDPLGLIDLVTRDIPDTGAPIAPDPATGRLLGPDGRAILIVATTNRPAQDIDYSRRLAGALDELLPRLRERFDREGLAIDIDHAGGHMFAVQDERSIRHDITTTASISMFAIVVLFGLVLRRLSLLLILLVPLTLSMMWTLGIARLYPGHLNVVTVAFAAILLGLGDDALMHLYLRFGEETRGGRDRGRALREAMSRTGPSILLATLTSGLAFAALRFVEFRGLSELGIIAAIGLVNLLAAVLFLFPALLSLGPVDGPPIPPPRLPMEIVVRFHRWGTRHRGLVLGTALLVVAGAGLAALRIEFSPDVQALRGEDPAREALERVMRRFGGATEPIRILHDAPDRDASLERAERMIPVCARLKEEGRIVGCSSIASWLPSTRTQRSRFETLRDIDWSLVTRDLRAAVAPSDLRMAFFEPFVENLSAYGDWDRVRIDLDALDAETARDLGVAGALVVTTMYPAPGEEAAAVLERARAIDPTVADERAASIALVVSDLGEVIRADFRRASLIAVAAVLLIVLAALRSLSRTILVACPVIVGGLLMLGGLAVIGVPINLMNLVAAPLVFGLGIDFGVYMVSRYEQEGDIVSVLRHTGGAILLTGLTTITGFGSLLAADFAGLRSMGWVAVLGIGGCLISALFLLPLLLTGGRGGSVS